MEIVTTKAVKPYGSWGENTTDMYEILDQIGEGTYGRVYKARNKITNDIVALKKIRMENEKEGFPITAIREIKILRALKSDNIVQLKDIISSKSSDDKDEKGSIFLVFEFMEHDLAGLMDQPSYKYWKPMHIKCYIKQLLVGLHELHHNNILHRDIKAANLLVNDKGILKLADFGLARPVVDGNCTPTVITLWYRPPELLLGSQRYTAAVDMWSVGCLLAELIMKRPLFPGKTEIDQLDLIFRVFGTPSDDNWPAGRELPWYNKLKPARTYKNRAKEAFKDFTATEFDLVTKLLRLDPKERLSASDALDHPYFWTDPLPCDPSELPTAPSSHEYTMKKRRQREQQAAMQMRSEEPPSKRPKVEPGMHMNGAPHRPPASAPATHPHTSHSSYPSQSSHTHPTQPTHPTHPAQHTQSGASASRSSTSNGYGHPASHPPSSSSNSSNARHQVPPPTSHQPRQPAPAGAGRPAVVPPVPLMMSTLPGVAPMSVVAPPHPGARKAPLPPR